MTTQTKSKKNNSGFKAGLKTILVVGGTLLIPFYAIYFNTGTDEKLEVLKSSKPVVKTMKMHIEKTDSHLAVNMNPFNPVESLQPVKGEELAEMGRDYRRSLLKVSIRGVRPNRRHVCQLERQ